MEMNSRSEKKAKTDIIEEGSRTVGCPELELSKQEEVTWNRICHGSQRKNLKRAGARCPRDQVSFSSRYIVRRMVQRFSGSYAGGRGARGVMVGEPILGGNMGENVIAAGG